MADPAQRDEIVALSSGAAAAYGLHLGSVLPAAFFTTAQVNTPNFTGYPQNRPHLIARLKLVGIVEWIPQSRPG